MGEIEIAALTGFKRGLAWLKTPPGIAFMIVALIIGVVAGVLA
jgi:hypothetical protein